MKKFADTHIDSYNHKTKLDELPWQKQGLQQTASGYGSKLVTPYKIRYAGRWRRVYAVCWSNSGTAYITVNGENIFVR